MRQRNMTKEEKQRFINEMAVAEPGKNWGFCSEECKYRAIQRGATYKGVSVLSVIEPSKCKELLGVRGCSYITLSEAYLIGLNPSPVVISRYYLAYPPKDLVSR